MLYRTLTVLAVASEVEFEAEEVRASVEGVGLSNEDFLDGIVGVHDDGIVAAHFEGVDGAELILQFREALVRALAVLPEAEQVAEEGDWSRAGRWCWLGDLQVVTALRCC